MNLKKVTGNLNDRLVVAPGLLTSDRRDLFVDDDTGQVYAIAKGSPKHPDNQTEAERPGSEP